MGGVGAASSAIGYAYVAKALPIDKQTKINSMFSAIRIIGMASGPGVNVFLAGMNFKIGNFQVDPLNSVGLVLVVMNLTAILAIYFLLEEPEPSSGKTADTGGKNAVAEKNDPWLLIKVLLRPDIFVYIFSIISFNANFQLIETAFTPAAKDALGWGPVQTSGVLGSVSILIFCSMIIVFQLSARKVPDGYLLSYGLIQGSIGYTLMYFLWTSDGTTLTYTIPIIVGASSFPFMGAPTRSLFTKNVDAIPALDEHHGMMQALLSMGNSVAGFVAPGLIATFVLRDPEDVDNSANGNELTAFALYAPVMSMLTLIGHWYVVYQHKKLDKEVGDSDEEVGSEQIPNERSSLVRRNSALRNSVELHQRKYDPRSSMHRHSSTAIMGVCQPNLFGEDLESEFMD